ncbi:GAF domain-containing protein [Chloroflexota bacterium]
MLKGNKIKRINKKEQPGEQYRASGEYLQAIVNSLGDELMVIDRDFRITQVNTALLNKHKATAAKVIGRHCYEVSHDLQEPCHETTCECPITKVWKTGKPVTVTHIHLYQRGEGIQERYINISASPLRDKRGHITEVVELMSDITEAKMLENQLKEALGNLLALNSISIAISQSLDLDTILNSALEKVLELMNGSAGAILLLDEESQTLSCRAHRGLSQEFAQGIDGLKSGEGIIGKVAQCGEPIFVDNIADDPRIMSPVVKKEGLRAFASVPLKSKKKTVGVMNIASHGIRLFRAKDIQLLNSIANQLSLAIDNAKLYDYIQQRGNIHGDVLNLIISTQEEERKRIARGLHDETSQSLTSLVVNLETVLKLLPPDAEEAMNKLRAIQSLTVRTLDEIHKVIYELRPTLLDDIGLIAAIGWHIENYLETRDIKGRLKVTGAKRRLPVRIETALFRITQEATANIFKHSKAKKANISLRFNKSSVTIRIKDDGKGFNLDDVMIPRKNEGRLGLLSMKERAELLGGVLIINSQPGTGTDVTVKIPTSEEISDEQDTSINSR